MVVIVFSVMVQKFLPLRTFLLGSQAQAIGESQGLQKEVTHPRPSGPVASEEPGQPHPQAASVLHAIIKPAPAWHA